MRINKRIRLFAIAVMTTMFLTGCVDVNDVQMSTTAPDTVTETVVESTEAVTTADTVPESTEEAASVTEATEESTEPVVETAAAFTEGTPAINITMLNVEQGLSMLVESDGQYMLYDGGGRNRSSYVVAYLRQRGIDHLSYLIASHYDEDHINGLVGVLATTAVDTVIDPSYSTDTNIYRSYREKLAANGANEINPAVGDVYTLGKAEFQICGPIGNYDDKNNNSIVVMITCNDYKCIITGDAESEAESAMLSAGTLNDVDLYVVGHHGSSSSTSESFLSTIAPEYAFLSVGAGNSYGHPAEGTMARLQAHGVQLFRSDIQQEVTCTSDGYSYWFDKAPCNDYTPGKKEEPATTAQETAAVTTGGTGGCTYIVNTHTGKFHYPNCSSVSDMNEANKMATDKTRDQLISEGYSPCGRCKP